MEGIVYIFDMHLKIRYTFFLLLFLWIQDLNAQSVYYVSNSGNDQEKGNLDQPWKKVQFGLDQLLPGDTLYVRAGIYNEKLRMDRSGNGDEFIMVCGFPGETVVLDGGASDSSVPLMSIENQSFIHFKGFELSNNSGGDGRAVLVKNSSNIIIENNVIHSNDIGIHIFNVDIDNDHIDNQILNNRIYTNSQQALIIGPQSSDTYQGLQKGLIIRNNSFFQNDQSRKGLGELMVSFCHECVFVNNIVFMHEQSFVGEMHEYFYDLRFDYNGYYAADNSVLPGFEWNGTFFPGLDLFQEATNEEPNGIYAHPLFTDLNVTAPDLHLSPASPMIERGDNLMEIGPGAVDIDGQNRINGSIDIGADEYYLNFIICALGIFDASLENDRAILEWSGTCYSENGGKYQIQRSRNSIDWETIGEEFSQFDKLNTEVTYTYIDNTPLEGISYYRVRFIDDNGSFTDSNPDVIQYVKEKILLYPNPASNQLFVLAETEYQEPELYIIYDIHGNVSTLLNGSDKWIDVSFLEMGLYYFVVSFNGRRVVKEFEIIR